MVVVFVVALLALQARQPEPVRVTEKCRTAFDQYAIAHDTDSLFATLGACANGQGGWIGEEWFKAERHVLKLGQSEAETLYRHACSAAWEQRRLPENTCGGFAAD